MEFEFKDKYKSEDLVKIVRILRSPEGCPWDKVQTHRSIRKDFIEEVYEAIDAIDSGDDEHLREELGDVLLQVVFHCVLAEEEKSFDINDVADDICKKMIIRHPHVFGDVDAETTDEVLKNWDEIKMKTHSQKSTSEAMDSVSKTLPSLMRAGKLQKKARRCGVGPVDAFSALDRIKAAVNELEKSVSSDDKGKTRIAIGKLLFSVVNISEFTGTDCEHSLYDTCEEFTERFKAFEKAAAQKGIDIQDPDKELTDQLWITITKEKLEES